MPHNDIPAFHAFTIKHNVRVNRIVTPVKLSKAFIPDNSSQSPYPPIDTTALWDTGATKSVITKATIDRLGLIPVGTTIVNHAGGSSESNTYLINVVLPNNVGVAGVLVNACENIVGDFGVIIGMDIITKGDLSITNTNDQTCMTFRTPSIGTTDYVAEANKINYAGIGRNAPCPCGKKDEHGKPVKFKYCHGKHL